VRWQWSGLPVEEDRAERKRRTGREVGANLANRLLVISDFPHLGGLAMVGGAMGGLFGGARARAAAAGAGIVAAGLVAAGLVAGQAVAAPAVTVTGIQAPLPANAAVIAEASLPSVSCASAGTCTAVGSYTDSSGHGQGLLVTEASGSWTGVEAALPANALPNPEASLSSVSCASAGSCTAAGSYDAPGQQGLLLTETSGSWTAAEAALPANANSQPQASLSSVSCASAGNCTAVGTYFDSSVHHQGLLLTEASGSWAAGVEALLPANAAPDPAAVLFSVSCASAGNCSAAGGYTDSSGNQQGLLLTETSGSWTTAEAVLPADAAGNPAVGLTPVSCASAGNCTAVGYYLGSSGQQGLLLTEASGSWAAGVEAPLPANAGSDPAAAVNSVSCASAGNCTAAGGYTDSSGYQQGLLLTETSGSWTAGQAALPANAAASYPDVYLSSVSCASAGNCAVAGHYVDGSRSLQGLLLTETSGSWTATPAALPADAGSDQIAVLTSVSCASAGNCTATGNYIDSSGIDQDLLLTQSPPDTGTTQTAASCSPDPVLTGSAATCTATVTDTSSNPSVPGGQVSFSSATGTFPADSSCTLTPVADSISQASCQVSYTQDQAGTARITADYTAGDGVHQASSGSPALTVLDPTRAAVSCAPNPLLAGTTSRCTATVTDTADASLSPPGGQVSFASTGSGSFPGGSSCTLAPAAGSSQASCQVSYTQQDTGQAQISIGYPGDSTHASAPAAGSPAVSTVLSVIRSVTTTTLASSANPSVAGHQVIYTATANPLPDGGTVAFTDNGSPIAGCGAQPVNTTTGQATCQTAPGTSGAHNIAAAFSGTSDFAGSTSAVLTQVVTSTPCQSLAGCNLHGLNLTGAQLSGANLSNANLNGANLTGADFSGADLSGANLNGANLTGADLSGTDVTGANFNKVTWSDTTCPDGTDSNADGGTCTGHL
jgi:pentapeptide repeat protein/Big-like domain-containing protein